VTARDLLLVAAVALVCLAVGAVSWPGAALVGAAGCVALWFLTDDDEEG